MLTTPIRLYMPTECKNLFQMLSFQNIYAQRILFLSIEHWSTYFHHFRRELLISSSKMFQTLDTTDLCCLCLNHGMTTSYKHDLVPKTSEAVNQLIFSEYHFLVMKLQPRDWRKIGNQTSLGESQFGVGVVHWNRLLL